MGFELFYFIGVVSLYSDIIRNWSCKRKGGEFSMDK